MTYRAVLFDMDGVIIDSEQVHMAAFRAVLKRYGHDLTDKHYKQHFMGKTDEAGLKLYFEFMNERVDQGVVLDKKAKAYLALAADQLIAYPGIIEFIRELDQRAVALALVTGSLRAEADITLKAFELKPFFSAVIAAEDITASKPSPDGYLKGAEALGVKPTDCIVIEDAPSGVAAAKAAGMRCVAVTTTHSAEELKGATRIVDQLRLGCLDDF